MKGLEERRYKSSSERGKTMREGIRIGSKKGLGKNEGRGKEEKKRVKTV